MPAAAGNHPGHQPGTTQARHLTGQGQLPCAHKGPNFVSVTKEKMGHFVARRDCGSNGVSGPITPGLMGLAGKVP